MNLEQYIDDLHEQLMVAAEAGGEETRLLAERLTAPLASATRLILLEALSAAAHEITRDLAPGSVDLRLRGRDPEFVVTSPPMEASFNDGAGTDPGTLSATYRTAPTSSGTAPAPPDGSSAPPDGSSAPPDGSSAPPDGSSASSDAAVGNTSRLTVRLPEPLKLRIEDSANREGLSVNSWLVRAAAAALDPGKGARSTSTSTGRSSGGQRLSGWVR